MCVCVCVQTNVVVWGNTNNCLTLRGSGWSEGVDHRTVVRDGRPILVCV